MSARPNVILIVSDDHGYGDRSALGQDGAVSTPALDRLASEGVSCTSAYVTAPICSPSRAGLISGVYQQRWGARWFDSSRFGDHLPSLAERFRELGYATGYLGKVHYGPERRGDRACPPRHGFDEAYYGLAGQQMGRLNYLHHSQEAVERYGPEASWRMAVQPMLEARRSGSDGSGASAARVSGPGATAAVGGRGMTGTAEAADASGAADGTGAAGASDAARASVAADSAPTTSGDGSGDTARAADAAGVVGDAAGMAGAGDGSHPIDGGDSSDGGGEAGDGTGSGEVTGIDGGCGGGDGTGSGGGTTLSEGAAHGGVGDPDGVVEREVDLEGFLTDELGARARDFVGRHAQEPFFLMLAFNAVHNFCFQLPDDELERRGLARFADWDPSVNDYVDWYDGAISPHLPEGRAYYLAQLELMDAQIGRLLDHLDAHQLTDNTIVVYVTDNGGSTCNFGVNTPLRGTKYTLWEGGIRIPILVRWPAGHIAGGRTYDELVSTLDLYPTLLSAAGADVGAYAHSDGIDQLRGLRGDATARGHEALFWDCGFQWAVREGTWKLRHADDGPHTDALRRTEHTDTGPGLWLTDLSTDIGETRNLVTDHPGQVERLLAMWVSWHERIEHANEYAESEDPSGEARDPQG